MKKLIHSISTLIFLLILLTGLDLYSVYSRSMPIFSIKIEKDSFNTIYRGLLYDVYNCAEYSAPQIKLKNNKFNCPITNILNESDKKMAKLTLVGDLLFEQPFYNAIDNGYDTNEYFSLVKDYFENDDLSIGNMEVVIGNDSLETSGVGYNFCAPKYIGDLVNTVDFEILGTANNHAYDRGIEGINSTIDYFENKTDIKTVGTYKNNQDRENYRILNINDINFGFLAYTYGTNQKPKREEFDLIGYYKDPLTKEITSEYKDKIKNEVKKIKEQSDILVVLMHWGTEFTYIPNSEQKEMARYLNSLGVDIIVGSHSHNIQPIEVIGEDHKTLVYYSLGNFVSHDDDIARTPSGEEVFDNAYQVGLLSNLKVVLENNKVNLEDITTELIVNYFDKDMNNFKLIPFKNYSEEEEKTHYRYDKGLTKDFISNMYEQVISESYR